nr:hypothetical protein [Tanacetum cinerariifolium]
LVAVHPHGAVGHHAIKLHPHAALALGGGHHKLLAVPAYATGQVAAAAAGRSFAVVGPGYAPVVGHGHSFPAGVAKGGLLGTGSILLAEVPVGIEGRGGAGGRLGPSPLQGEHGQSKQTNVTPANRHSKREKGHWLQGNGFRVDGGPRQADGDHGGGGEGKRQAHGDEKGNFVAPVPVGKGGEAALAANAQQVLPGEHNGQHQRGNYGEPAHPHQPRLVGAGPQVAPVDVEGEDGGNGIGLAGQRGHNGRREGSQR